MRASGEEDAVAVLVSVESWWQSWRSVTVLFMSDVIRSRDGCRTVGGKGISCRTPRVLFAPRARSNIPLRGALPSGRVWRGNFWQGCHKINYEVATLSHAGNGSGSSWATTLTVGRANKCLELGSLWLLSRAAFAPIRITTSLNTKGLAQGGNRTVLLLTMHHHKLYGVSDIKRAVASSCPWGIFRMLFSVSIRRSFFFTFLVLC